MILSRLSSFVSRLKCLLFAHDWTMGMKEFHLCRRCGKVIGRSGAGDGR